MSKKAERPRMTVSMQRKVAAWASKHPDESVRDVARYWDVSYDQARNAIEKHKAGKLATPPGRPSDKKVVAAITGELDVDAIIARQHEYAAAQLMASESMPVHERVKLVGDLVAIRKTIQAVTLQGHMKRIDAAVVAAIIRRYEPNATDDDVLRIYAEAVDQTRVTQ